MDDGEAIRIFRSKPKLMATSPSRRALSSPGRGKGSRGGKKSAAKRKLRFGMEESADEEEWERGMDSSEGPMVDHSLFNKLKDEFDKGVEECVGRHYARVLDAFGELLRSDNGNVECLVPTLFLCGHCVDWDSLFRLLEAKHPNVLIRRSKFALHENFDELACNLPKLEKGHKLLLFIHIDCLTTGEAYTNILEQVADRNSVFLAFHTMTSFTTISERISRHTFTKMRTHSIVMPPTEQFLRSLLEDIFPFGFMANSAVQFHGRTLASAQRQFQAENRSLATVRKIFLLALLEYAIRGADGKPKKAETGNFIARVLLSKQLLGAFVQLVGDGLDPFELHCRIQAESEDFFAKQYNEQREKMERWPKDTWIRKFAELGRQMKAMPGLDQELKGRCKELTQLLTENPKGNGTAEEPENDPPPMRAQTKPPFGRKSGKSTQYFAERNRMRTNLLNPMPKSTLGELFSFLDSLFPAHLGQFPAKFVAGPGTCSLLNPSLSMEIDDRLQLGADLAQKLNENEQLDVCLVFALMVNFDVDSYSISLAKLERLFCEMAQPIPGLEAEARFLSAISQLEYIGVVKVPSGRESGTVRLIYLPAANLTQQEVLFEKH